MSNSFFYRLKSGLLLIATVVALPSCMAGTADPGDASEQAEVQEQDLSAAAALEADRALPGVSAAATKAVFELNNALLPFDMPARADLATRGYKVFAHWHNFPLRQLSSTNGDKHIDWLKPTGEFAAIGGRIRDRPIPILPVPPETNYLLNDMKLDIETAAAVGIDGFLINFWFSPTDARWKWVTNLFSAANQFNTANPSAPFQVIPNLDIHILSGSSTAKNEPRKWADYVATLKGNPSWMKLNGKYVVGTFQPEAILPADGSSDTWFTQFFDQLKTVHGIDAVMWGSLSKPTDSNRNRLKPFMTGATFSRWDNLPYTGNFAASVSAQKTWGDQNGIPYSPPVSHTDHRPSSGWALETAGFKTQLESWKAAINSGVKMVQILTWNDHYEGHALRPNSAMQYATYDLTAYYTTWFKTRQRPTIVRDVLYYSHRMHLSTAAPDLRQQSRVFTSKNDVPFLDKVFLLGMLKSSGRLQITSGGTVYPPTPVDFGAGPQFFEAPLNVNDRPRFRLIRNGATVVDVTSAFPTRPSIVWQDLMYRAGSSSRPVVDGVQDDLPQDRLP